ncbi:MAG TPA: hypothetical protein VK158_01300 [Acidobacteriota bacterium]|nr:hypothetical protein [Acidobacteriota bacterium]
MKGNRKLMIRVTEQQYELIKNRMANFGHTTISQYARDCMTRDDLHTLTILREIKLLLEGDRDHGNKKLEKK